MPYTLQEAVTTRDHTASWLHDSRIPEEYRAGIVKTVHAKSEKPSVDDLLDTMSEFVEQWNAGVAKDDVLLEKTAEARGKKLTGIDIFSGIIADHR